MGTSLAFRSPEMEHKFLDYYHVGKRATDLLFTFVMALLDMVWTLNGVTSHNIARVNIILWFIRGNQFLRAAPLLAGTCLTARWYGKVRPWLITTIRLARCLTSLVCWLVGTQRSTAPRTCATAKVFLWEACSHPMMQGLYLPLPLTLQIPLMALSTSLNSRVMLARHLQCDVVEGLYPHVPDPSGCQPIMRFMGMLVEPLHSIASKITAVLAASIPPPWHSTRFGAEMGPWVDVMVSTNTASHKSYLPLYLTTPCRQFVLLVTCLCTLASHCILYCQERAGRLAFLRARTPVAGLADAIWDEEMRRMQQRKLPFLRLILLAGSPALFAAATRAP